MFRDGEIGSGMVRVRVVRSEGPDGTERDTLLSGMVLAQSLVVCSFRLGHGSVTGSMLIDAHSGSLYCSVM